MSASSSARALSVPETSMRLNCKTMCEGSFHVEETSAIC